jgi:hypothetical protein
VVPIAPVRGADRGDAFDGRRIVEQHAAAAIDLGVDEPGKQGRALKIVAHRIGGDFARRDDREDALALDQHSFIVAKDTRAKHAAIDQSSDHQTVSVTLASRGGRSGSSPRRSDSALTAR